MISEKQKAVVNFANEGGSLLLSCGPVRSGKTFANTLGFLLFTQSLDQPYEHLILGRNQDTLDSACIKPMTKLAEALGVDSHYRPHKSWLRIGRQEYHVRGGENTASASAIQGLTAHSGLFDEVTLFPRPFFEMGLSRLTFPDSKLWASCNPEGPVHFIKTDFMDAGKFDAVFDFEFKDNPALSKETRQRLESLYAGVFYERKIKGVWAAAEGLVFPIFKITQSPPGRGSKLKSCALGVDVGNATTSAILAMQNYQNDKHRIIDERTLRGKRGSGRTDDEIVQAVAEIAAEHGAEVVIVDPAAASTIEALRAYPQRKWRVKRAKNQIIPGVRHTGAALASGKVTISPKCKELIKELEGYQWGENEKPKKENDHHADALRYLCMSEVKRAMNYGPIPLPHGL